MTPASRPHLDPDFALFPAVRAYVDAVSRALGLGWESCSVDLERPLAAYIALDRRLSAHPGCDVALLWHEARGWSAVLETPSGEELTLARLPRPILPEPRAVAAFASDLPSAPATALVKDLSAGHRSRTPPRPLTTAELLAALAAYVELPLL